jgi:hypothetical protein
MAKLYYLLGISVFVGAAGVCALAFAGSHPAKTRASRAATIVLHDTATPAPDQQEIARLRADLQRKDSIIRAMAASRVQDDRASEAPPPVAPSNGVEDPLAAACDTLDERMLTAPQDVRRTAEMERTVDAMLDPKALGQTKVSSRQCGGTMCKLVLVGASPSSLNESIVAMGQRSSKQFSGTITYPSGTNESTVYLATNRDDLKPSPTPQEQL